MLNRIHVFFVAVPVTIIVSLLGVLMFVGKNDVQNFQIMQSMAGNVVVRSNGGYYTKFFHRVWTYPKTDSVFFSSQRAESKDNDGIEVRFSNKGTGTISCQVVYRLFSEDTKMRKLHEYCGGDLDKLDNIVLAKIKEHAGNECAKRDSSSAVEMREQLAGDIRKKLVEDIELKDKGIDMETFVITAIGFDEVTENLFTAQRQADLQKRTFQAEEEKLQMEKKKTVAQAEQQIAEAKGKAEVDKMTMVTQAEKEKELAEIEARKKVAVEQLAKEEALVKAQKQVELAELTRAEEEIVLATVKLKASQMVAEAEAKEQQIKLSGAITEAERVRLEIEKETKVGIAEAIAGGVKDWKLPQTVILDKEAGAGTASDALGSLLKLMTIQKAQEISASDR